MVSRRAAANKISPFRALLFYFGLVFLFQRFLFLRNMSRSCKKAHLSQNLYVKALTISDIDCLRADGT